MMEQENILRQNLSREKGMQKFLTPAGENPKKRVFPWWFVYVLSRKIAAMAGFAGNATHRDQYCTNTVARRIITPVLARIRSHPIRKPANGWM